MKTEVTIRIRPEGTTIWSDGVPQVVFPKQIDIEIDGDLWSLDRLIEEAGIEK